MVVDSNIGCNVEVGAALADNRVVEVAIEKTADLTEEVADVSIFEEAMEGIDEISEEFIEIPGVEVGTDCIVKVVDDVTSAEEVVKLVGSAIVDRVVITENDAVTVLVETATPIDAATSVDKTVATEDVEGRALEEGSSALMMSAAFAQVLKFALLHFRFRFSYLFRHCIYDGLQMCSWDCWEDARINNSQILRAYTD